MKSTKTTSKVVKKWMRITSLLLLPVALLFSLFCWSLWRSISRFENPMEIAIAMIRLKLTKAQITPIGVRSDTFLAEMKTGQKALDQKLLISGWSRVAWMGSQGESRKGNQRMKIFDFAVSRYFRAFGLGRSPYKVRGTLN